MKIIRTLLLSALLLSSFQVCPDYVQASVCQNKTAIIYGNGIYNTKRMARDSLVHVLQEKLLGHPPASLDLDKFEYKLAYADNSGAAGPFSLSGMAQLHELYVQRNASEDSSFWRWLGESAVAPAWFKTLMIDKAVQINAAAYVNDASHQKQLQGDPANPSLQPGYRTLLNQGMKVIIVAHSQGNLYANAAHDALITEKPAWSASLGIISVASVDWRVAGGGPHITVPEDEAIASMSMIYSSTLPPTPASGFSSNMIDLGGLGPWSKASYGHSFTKWYMAGPSTRSFILNSILNAHAALNSADYDMAPLMVTTGTQVAPGPDGSIYVTRESGVVKIDVDGVETAVPGVPRVDFVDSAKNLYYSDLLIDPTDLQNIQAATTIYKMDSSGIVSVVYSGFGKSIKSYDVALDGTAYVLNGVPYYTVDGYLHVLPGGPPRSSAYTVKDGVTTLIVSGYYRIFAVPPGPVIAGIGVLALDAEYFAELESIFDARNGEFSIGLRATNASGGAYNHWVDSSGKITPKMNISRTRKNFDFCSNGNTVNVVGHLGSAFLDDSFNRVNIAQIGTGVPTNISSVALSHDDKDLYFVDPSTSTVMKLVGKPN